MKVYMILILSFISVFSFGMEEEKGKIDNNEVITKALVTDFTYQYYSNFLAIFNKEIGDEILSSPIDEKIDERIKEIKAVINTFDCESIKSIMQKFFLDKCFNSNWKNCLGETRSIIKEIVYEPLESNLKDKEELFNYIKQNKSFLIVKILNCFYEYEKDQNSNKESIKVIADIRNGFNEKFSELLKNLEDLKKLRK